MATRPSAGGGLKTVIDRLIGMALGIVVGLALATTRIWHVPEVALVGIAMVPLCFVVARFRKYQAAPITAILVLSVGASMESELKGAALRVAEVCLGAAIGFAVSAIVFRRSTDRRSRQHAANVLNGCGALMVAATAGGKPARDAALRNHIRADLRMVMSTSKLLRSRGCAIGQAHIAGLGRLQSDLMIYGRALFDLPAPWRMRARPVLDRLAGAFQLLCTQAADYLLEEAPPPSFSTFDGAVLALQAASAQRGMPNGAEAAQALPFLIARLRADLADLLGGYAEQSGHPAPNADADIDEAPVYTLASG